MDTWMGYADGGSRGNPGPAGFGWVLMKNGEMVRTGKKFLGVATNNQAEWQGVLALLAAALEEGAQVLEVRADSELVIRQCLGRYKVKHPGLKPLHAQAMGLAAKFRQVRWVHVARELNKQADALANEAMDGGGR